jgi:hypothetical protein
MSARDESKFRQHWGLEPHGEGLHVVHGSFPLLRISRPVVKVGGMTSITPVTEGCRRDLADGGRDVAEGPDNRRLLYRHCNRDERNDS